MPARVRNEVTIVLGQRKLLQRFGPGLMHAFIFWGFLVLAPTILIAMIGIVDRHQTLPWLGHQGWYALLVDIFCVLVLVGVARALWIRKVVRPKRFEGSHLGEADLILGDDRDDRDLAAAVARVADRARAATSGRASWSPVSNAALAPVRGDGTTRVLERVFVWIHVAARSSTFLAYLPRSKHLHIATAAFNVWFGRTRGRGRLEPLRFEPAEGESEDDLRFGAGTAADLTWKQVLDTLLVHRVRPLPGRLPGHS